MGKKARKRKSRERNNVATPKRVFYFGTSTSLLERYIVNGIISHSFVTTDLTDALLYASDRTRCNKVDNDEPAVLVLELGYGDLSQCVLRKDKHVDGHIGQDHHNWHQL